MRSRALQGASRFVVFFVVALLCWAPVVSGYSPQEAGRQPPVSTTAQTAAGGKLPLRVMLVIGGAARSYQARITFFHIKLGGCLASKMEKDFELEFSQLTTASEVPTSPHGLDNIDLIVSVENLRGEIHMSWHNTNPMTLAGDFSARNHKGEEIFRAQETVNVDAKDVNSGCDEVGEALSRQFLKDLLASPAMQALLTPKPDTDTPIMDSAGLDVPPGPPWEERRGSSPLLKQPGRDFRP